MTKAISYYRLNSLSDQLLGRDSRILIENLCLNPPWALLRHLQRSLTWINQADLEGIKKIQLLDVLGEPTAQTPDWRIHQAKGRGLLGWYNQHSAQITLHIREIYRGVPSLYWWTTVPTLLITRTLAHEVAHHLAAQRGFIHSRSEKAGDKIEVESAAENYAL